MIITSNNKYLEYLKIVNIINRKKKNKIFILFWYLIIYLDILIYYIFDFLLSEIILLRFIYHYILII